MTVLKVAAMALGLLVAISILWHLIGIVAGVLWTLFLIACLAGAAYFVYAVLQSKQPTPPEPKAKYLVWDTHSQNVQLFRAEPSIEDIVQGVSEPATYLSEGRVDEVPNSTSVSILEDKGGMAVKVKVIDGERKAKVGWVSRTLLVRSK